jgi:hypothetical protein
MQSDSTHPELFDVTPEKRCSTCKQVKSLSEFSKGCYKCKPCAARYMAAWKKSRKPAEATTSGSKRCAKCSLEKPVTEFRKDRAATDGRCYYCKPCHTQSTAAWFKAMNPIRARSYGLKKYGITEEEYQAMLKAQDGRCAICGMAESVISHHTKRIKRFAIDHDHATGRVRGLLCNRCNVGIGMLRHDPELLKAAIAYVEST